MSDVEIYTTRFCGFCMRAKRVLDAKNVAYVEHSVDGDWEARAAMMERAQGRRTVPQIFIDGKGIGGSDELHWLDAQGELDRLLGL